MISGSALRYYVHNTSENILPKHLYLRSQHTRCLIGQTSSISFYQPVLFPLLPRVAAIIAILFPVSKGPYTSFLFIQKAIQQLWWYSQLDTIWHKYSPSEQLHVPL